MKKLLVMAAAVALLTSCAPKIEPVTINTGDFAAAPITLDLPGDWQQPDVETTARLSKKKGEGDFTIEYLKMDQCKLDAAVLKSTTLENVDYQGATVTEELKLKNGIGLKLDKPAADGKGTEKHFVMLVQAKGKCYMIHNNPYYDTQYKAYDVEKTIIESIR